MQNIENPWKFLIEAEESNTEGDVQMTIEELIKTAAEHKSSDIHLTPDYPVMYRVNGEVTVIDDKVLFDKRDAESLLNEVLDEEQKRILKEQGELDFAYSIEDDSRVRMNVYKQRGTYAISIRILSKVIPMPEELLLPQAVIEMIHKKRGLVLFTGAVGSGRSTTIASLIHKMAQVYARNIITIENPIEYIHTYSKSMICQREVGYDTGSYANGVKAALRQDPDVIFVGEMQDMETILTVLNAAEAGNLVFSALHSSSVKEAVERMVDVFPASQKEQIRVQLSNVLEGVVAQQFIKKEDAKERIAAFEVMIGNEEIREAIRKGNTHHINGLLQKNKQAGMQTMDDAIFDLYMKSQISAETAISYALDQISMKQKVTIL